MEEFNTIIIGAGPSGLAAGQTLLKNNINCCIIEKSTFPRLKLCGGLLPYKTLELLKELDFSVDNENLNKNAVKDFEILDNGKSIFKIECDDEFVLVDRVKLDNYMSNKFKANGGILKEDEKVIDIDLDNCVITTTKSTYKYHNLICADGLAGINTC